MSQPAWAESDHCGIFQHDFPDTGPEVAVLIPTRNRLDLLKNCLRSLRATTYRNFHVVIADNLSDEPATLDYLATVRARVLRIGNNGPAFSYSYLNNRAVEQIDAPYVLFLNNDTQVSEPRWLSRMMGFAQMSGVGAVGARLFYPDHSVQHAGVVQLQGPFRGMPSHAFRCLYRWQRGYLYHAVVSRNYSAVTGAACSRPVACFSTSGGSTKKTSPWASTTSTTDTAWSSAVTAASIVPARSCFTWREAAARETSIRTKRPLFAASTAGASIPGTTPTWLRTTSSSRFSRGAWRSRGPRRSAALLCSHNLNLEGAPITLCDLATGLKEQGALDPVVFSPSPGPLADVYARAGIPVVVRNSPMAGVRTAADFDRAMDELAEFVRQQNVEVVHANTLVSYFAIAAAQRAGLPSLWSVHESEPWQTYFDFLPKSLRGRAYQCFRFPYRVVFVADATRRAWSDLDARKHSP